jgi:hypothetical protein
LVNTQEATKWFKSPCGEIAETLMNPISVRITAFTRPWVYFLGMANKSGIKQTSKFIKEPPIKKAGKTGLSQSNQAGEIAN